MKRKKNKSVCKEFGNLFCLISTITIFFFYLKMVNEIRETFFEAVLQQIVLVHNGE